MQLNGKHAIAATLMALAAAGNAYAVTALVAASPEQQTLFDGAPALAHAADDSAATMRQRVAFRADPTEPVPAAVLAAAQANEMAEETSPYEMLLLGAGVMVLVSRSGKKTAPWAPSTVA